MSDSKYSNSVPRKRRAHESNANHSENNDVSTMAQKMHEEDFHDRHYDIAASSEWDTRHSSNVNNLHIRRRKQFIRYV